MKSRELQRWTLFIALMLCVWVVPPIYAEHFQGQIVIGSQVYEVAGEIQKTVHSGFHLHYSIRDGTLEVQRLEAVIGKSNGFILQDAQSLTVDSSLIRSWMDQLSDGMWAWQQRTGFLLLKETPDSAVLESSNTIPVTGFLEAKIRLVYVTSSVVSDNHVLLSPMTSDGRRLRLASFSLFSLSEWHNGFEDYVSMILFFER